MDNMTAQLADQLKQNPEMLRSLLQSGDGQKLIRMLTQGDQGAGLRRAAQAASAGDPAQMMQMVKRLMESPDGAALVERINRTANRR